MMTATISPPFSLPGTTTMFLRRFSLDEYRRMIDAGVFNRDDRFELLDGWIVAKMPHNPPHDLSVSLGFRQLLTRLPASWFCRVQSAISLAASAPEPDLAVVIGPERRYASAHPTSADIALLIEVSDSTLGDDRIEKSAIYARDNIAQYWILNLRDRVIEVYSDPTGPVTDPGYRQFHSFAENDRVPLIIKGQDCGAIPVGDLLP